MDHSDWCKSFLDGYYWPYPYQNLSHVNAWLKEPANWILFERAIIHGRADWELFAAHILGEEEENV